MAFYILYTILAGFFMFNIFVGSVVVTFSEEGEAHYAHSKLDKNQRKCILFAMVAEPDKTFVPPHRAQKAAFRLAESWLCESFILVCIALNSITLLMAFNDMGGGYAAFLGGCNIFFTAVFTAEALLKLFAYNPTGYFAVAWNVLDFAIVAGSLADIALAGQGVSISFLRLFRVARYCLPAGALSPCLANPHRVLLHLSCSGPGWCAW